jgi:hypothetical protein
VQANSAAPRTKTAHYGGYAAENTVYGELLQAAAAVATALWMKEKNIPIDRGLIEALAGPPEMTPSTTPSARAAVTRTRNSETGRERRIVHMFVGYSPVLQARVYRDIDKAVKPIVEGARAAQLEGHPDFTVRLGDRELRGVSLPVAEEREIGIKAMRWVPEVFRLDRGGRAQ